MLAVKQKKRSLKYCCICKGVHRGKVVDGRTVSLHRFPQNKKLKRVWIQRCRTVMRTFKWNEHKLICSEHFVEFRGPTILHTLPSIFPTENGARKVFPNTDLNENEQILDSEDEDPVEMYTATPINMAVYTVDGELTTTYSGPSFVQSVAHLALDVSLLLHYYCSGQVSTGDLKRNIATQTYPDMCSQATETEGESTVKQFASIGTQTSVETNDFNEQTNLPQLVYEDVMNTDAKIMFYTGIPDKNTFYALFDEIKDDAHEKTSSKASNYTSSSGGRPRALRIIDEFCMILMRLRLGLLVEDLEDRFCISPSACGHILNKWIDYLDPKLDFFIMWPAMEEVKYNMPRVFREKFPDTRVIIDCTEIRTETPSSLQYKSLMYSDYKSHMTYKSLVGISPSGHVTFISDLWCGSISDKEITKRSGLLELCEEGDAIMADKGFTISDLTTPKGIKLIIPPFKKKNVQFSKRDVQSTREIANARIHVERQMERIKNFRLCRALCK